MRMCDSRHRLWTTSSPRATLTGEHLAAYVGNRR
jgi:hypothetical protein